MQPRTASADTRSPSRVLVAAFVLAVLAFAASTMLTAVSLRRVPMRSREISATAMPRVVELAALREDLHGVEDDVEAAVDGPGANLANLAHRLDELDQRTAGFRALKGPSGADDDWNRASTSIAATLAGARHARELVIAGDSADAHAVLGSVVRPSARTADTDLWHLVRASAKEGMRAAQSIESMHERATNMSVVLDTCCVLISAVLALLVLRAMKRHTEVIEARSAELEQFAVRVAHDLRGPLQPVSLALQLLRQRLPSSDPNGAILDRGVASTARLTALIQDLLAFARSGGHPEPGVRANVRAGVESALQEAASDASSSQIELRAEGDLDATAACANGVLASMLSNLVRNAIKYMGHGAVRRVTVQAGRRAGRVRIEVRDTGQGLPAGAEARIFEPYVRVDRSGQPGLGLGLATVKRLAEAHGGAVGVDAREEGCTFWFELPEAGETRAQGPIVQRGP